MLPTALLQHVGQHAEPPGTRPLGSGAVTSMLRGLEQLVGAAPWSSLAQLRTLPTLLGGEVLAAEADMLPASV